MGVKKRKGVCKRKNPGRPLKRKSAADYNHRARHGLWPRGASAAEQLKVIVCKQGKLPAHVCRLAAGLPGLCTMPYENDIAIKRKGGATAFEILGTPGEKILNQLAEVLTGMQPYAPNPTDRPWILKTRGTCLPHIDCDDKRVFTLVMIGIVSTRRRAFARALGRPSHRRERAS